MRIPVYRPSLTSREKDLVVQCLESSWISSKGEFIAKFERAFSEFINIPYSASVCNGTVALHLALDALGIGLGDEVIVPTFTYIASVNAIRYVNATPVFVDSLSSTWQVDPKDIERKITSKTKAIMVVHLYGHPCEMNEIMAIARKYGLKVIEDCAEAIGTRYQGKHVGSWGDISTFSFFGNKTITTGEGGMVVSHSEQVHDRVVQRKGQGLAKHREYWHDVIGYNFRMTNICAAIGFAQLERVESLIQKKRDIAMQYKSNLEATPVEFHQEADGVFHSYWMCSILAPTAETRDSLREHLKEKGIETRPAFFPVHSMPMYEQPGVSFPIAQDLAARGVNLPSWPELSRADVEWITESIREYFKLDEQHREKKNVSDDQTLEIVF